MYVNKVTREELEKMVADWKANGNVIKEVERKKPRQTQDIINIHYYGETVKVM